MIRPLLVIVLAGIAAGTAACHKHSPIQPCTTADCAPVETLSLTCPSNVSLTTSSYTVTSAAVTYNAPAATGGAPPVTSSCTPASASVFSSGTTTVTCTATDAIARAATCSLQVTVNVPPPPIPILQGTTFLAFGDSITEGDNGCNNPCVLVVDTGYEYPTLLRSLLNGRYIQQTIAMDLEGKAGETAADGVERLRGLLQTSVPSALLLLEGVNDLNPGNDGTPGSVVSALKSDVDMAKAAGVKKVFLATLTPEIPGGPNSRAWAIPPKAATDLLMQTNNSIRSLATDEGVVLVDLYAALSANLRENVADPDLPADSTENGDGLHLTRAGRAAVAQAFFTAIQANFEVASSTQRLPARPTANRPAAAIRR